MENLPVPPALPFQEISVEFGGCANLCVYMMGAAYALQQAPGGSSIAWSFRGGSSGAFISAVCAAGCDASEFMLACYKRFTKERFRVGGCIGIYSRSVRGLLEEALLAEEQNGRDPLARARGRLSVTVTQFTPWPRQAVISDFISVPELVDSVLASCYIPVAYEEFVVLRNLGFCVDGCTIGFLANARCVVSPFHCQLPDVTPQCEYPGSLVFSLLNGEDVLRLFEDGYLDCVDWLLRGAPSNAVAREALARKPGSSIWALVWQGFKVGLSLLGLLPRSRR